MLLVLTRLKLSQSGNGGEDGQGSPTGTSVNPPKTPVTTGTVHFPAGSYSDSRAYGLAGGRGGGRKVAFKSPNPFETEEERLQRESADEKFQELLAGGTTVTKRRGPKEPGWIPGQDIFGPAGATAAIPKSPPTTLEGIGQLVAQNYNLMIRWFEDAGVRTSQLEKAFEKHEAAAVRLEMDKQKAFSQFTQTLTKCEQRLGRIEAITGVRTATHTANPFKKEDEQLLEFVCEKVASLYETHQK